MRKEAVKKVIASMTTGKDVSNLFPDVLKNVQTDDMELKKLVYLYLMNYAKSQPELVILAINSICKDSEDANPLVRALAIRTMGCLRVERVLDYLCEPLRKALYDENAYVRKTAATCVAKVAELSPALAEENGFIQMLQGMLADGNASVIANAVTALLEIQAQNPDLAAFQLDSRVANRLISVINECTEWGQIAILDALAYYVPADEGEAILFLEKIIPRLQHANSCLVLSTIKVIVIYLDQLACDHPLHDSIKKKLVPPLVSLLDAPLELQFVALRNISLILQKYPGLTLTQNVRPFFCKFNDPLYVKLEKLEILQRLVDHQNFDQILAELGEYAREVEVEFSHKSILAMAYCGSKVTIGFPKALLTLQKLVGDCSPTVVQSVAMAAQILLRTDPTSGYDLAKSLLDCELDAFDNDDARAAYVWLLGQFGPLLDTNRVAETLGQLVSDFNQECGLVQSELLTTLLKLFFQDGGSSTYKAYLKQVVDLGLISAEGNDWRERFMMMSKFLELDFTMLGDLNPNSLCLDPPQLVGVSLIVLEKLLPEIGSITSVYHSGETARALAGEAEQVQPLVMPDLLLDLEDDGEGGEEKVEDHSSKSFSITSSLPHPKSNASNIINESSHTSPAASGSASASISTSPVVDLLAD